MMKSLFAALAVLFALGLSPAFADEAKPLRSISISGHGEIRVIPDLAQISLGVASTALTAREALDANTKNMKTLMDTLAAAGIERRDMTTSNFSVGPRFDYGQGGNQPPKLVGYDVNNMLTLVVRKLDTLGTVLDQAVSSGSNQINGISFSVSKPDELLNQARKTAVADASDKAEIYAAAAGFKLGQVLSLSEGGGYQPPVPMMAKAARAESADAVPVAQGEQTLGIDVNLVWQIE